MFLWLLSYFTSDMFIVFSHFSLQRDALTPLAMVGEGNSNIVASFIPPVAREADARLAAQQSAGRSTNVMTRRGLVRLVPLLLGLFDQEPTNRIFVSLLTVTHIHPAKASFICLYFVCCCSVLLYASPVY